MDEIDTAIVRNFIFLDKISTTYGDNIIQLDEIAPVSESDFIPLDVLETVNDLFFIHLDEFDVVSRVIFINFAEFEAIGSLHPRPHHHRQFPQRLRRGAQRLDGGHRRIHQLFAQLAGPFDAGQLDEGQALLVLADVFAQDGG